MAEDSVSPENLEQALRSAQLEQLQLENEKLKRELAQHEKGTTLYNRLIQMIPLITTLIAIVGFIWGVVRYADEQNKNRDAQAAQALRQAVATEREFMKPWLDNQRDIYLQALTAAAVIANSDDPEKQKQAREDFWELYQGKMILVETKDIANANGVTSVGVATLMINYGRCLNGQDTCSKDEMIRRVHALATGMAASMAATARMTYQEFAGNQFHYTAGP